MTCPGPVSRIPVHTVKIYNQYNSHPPNIRLPRYLTQSKVSWRPMFRSKKVINLTSWYLFLKSVPAIFPNPTFPPFLYLSGRIVKTWRKRSLPPAILVPGPTRHSFLCLYKNYKSFHSKTVQTDPPISVLKYYTTSGPVIVVLTVADRCRTGLVQSYLQLRRVIRVFMAVIVTVNRWHH